MVQQGWWTFIWVVNLYSLSCLIIYCLTSIVITQILFIFNLCSIVCTSKCIKIHSPVVINDCSVLDGSPRNFRIVESSKSSKPFNGTDSRPWTSPVLFSAAVRNCISILINAFRNRSSFHVTAAARFVGLSSVGRRCLRSRERSTRARPNNRAGRANGFRFLVCAREKAADRTDLIWTASLPDEERNFSLRTSATLKNSPQRRKFTARLLGLLARFDRKSESD